MVLPWTILLIDVPECSVQEYFDGKVYQEVQKVTQKDPPHILHLVLEVAFFGKSTKNL